MSKIYTKTGDTGETGLFAGPRVRKSDLRLEAYGTIDELNSLLGVVRAEQPPRQIDELLEKIQNELFAIGAELATPDPVSSGTNLISDTHITSLENEIDHYEKGLEPLQQFILPGGIKAASALHLARVVCRRAERRIITLDDQPAVSVSPEVLRYINRLSDLLFVLARATNREAQQKDIFWSKPVAE